MKYSFDITIDAPLDLCIKKFNSTENMKHWQRGLESVEHISGIPGHIGAKLKIHFKLGNRRLTLLETITHTNFPHEFHATYASKNIDNHQEHYFTTVAENQTKWTCVCEFMPLNFRMHLMLLLMPNSFKKQILQYMKDFKNFVENGISVVHA